MQSNLLIFFASVSPPNIGRRNIKKRDAFYAMCLKRVRYLLRDRPWEILVVENTLSNEQGFQRSALGAAAAGLEVIVLSRNLGSSNKGIGELDMLTTVLEKFPIQKFSSVGYMTGRRLVTNPYVFEITERSKDKVVVGNPDFHFLDGKVVESEKKGMYGDMYFSMPPKEIIAYAKFFQREMTVGLSEGVGSEQLLFQFLCTREAELVTIEAYGFLRLEPMTLGRTRWHGC